MDAAGNTVPVALDSGEAVALGAADGRVLDALFSGAHQAKPEAAGT
jgi:hypothetical protein